MRFLRSLAAVGLGILVAVAAAGAGDKPAKPPCVFDLPGLAMSDGAVTGLFARKEYGKAAALLTSRLKRFPQDFNAHYNLACALARQGKTVEALDHLAKAVELGFHDAKHIAADDDLASLHKEARFQRLVAQAGEAAGASSEAAGAGVGGWKYNVQPAADKDGQATVSESNTAFNSRLHLLVSLFAIDDKAAAARPVVAGYGKAGELLGEVVQGRHGRRQPRRPVRQPRRRPLVHELQDLSAVDPRDLRRGGQAAASELGPAAMVPVQRGLASATPRRL